MEDVFCNWQPGCEGVRESKSSIELEPWAFGVTDTRIGVGGKDVPSMGLMGSKAQLLKGNVCNQYGVGQSEEEIKHTVLQTVRSAFFLPFYHSIKCWWLLEKFFPMVASVYC